MVKRKVAVLQTVAMAVAEIAYFIESKGLPATAKKFVDEAFIFFESLADTKVEYRFCTYKRWKALKYKCAVYKKKYVIAFISHDTEIIICDFVSSKLLKE
ncbi:MAG: hypothetical protein IPJ81_15840 [Chitinophagaceae bacterium]|nr:hypothetical protein [Chitinophagaceae bacterium]